MAVSPDGTHLYVTNFTPGSGSVSVINTATNTVTATIPFGGAETQPFDLVVSPDGSLAYVTNRGRQHRVGDDTATNTIIGAIPVGLNPQEVAVRPR